MTQKQQLARMLANNPNTKYYNKEVGKKRTIYFSPEAVGNPFRSEDKGTRTIGDMTNQQWESTQAWSRLVQPQIGTPVICWNNESPQSRVYKLYQEDDEFKYNQCQVLLSEEVPSWMK